MAARLLVTPSTLYQFMRLGYNGVTASSAQTQITTVIASSQMACNTAAMSGARTAKLGHTWTGGDFSASGICEAGIFDLISGAGSKMLARVTFTAVDKDSSSTLKITWTIKIN